MRSSVLAAGVIACVLFPPDGASGGDVDEGRSYFLQNCVSCHSMSCSRQHGPALEGIPGRAAGARIDFPYSEAMREAGIFWDVELLDAFLADPSTVVPGTTMRDGPGTRVAVADPEVRRSVIAYLATGDTSYDLC
jgi:cytochrome c